MKYEHKNNTSLPELRSTYVRRIYVRHSRRRTPVFSRNCFQKGFFTAASLDEQQKAIAVSGRKGHADLSNLKRWMPAVQQAAWILDQCGYVTLSTIDENGFPRPVAIDVLRHDGIATLWMTTSLSSEKVKHLRQNPKAGICYVHEADSVTLTERLKSLQTWKPAVLSGKTL